MKAYVLHGIGDLRYEEVETPELKKGEALIKVEAVGICGSDIPRIYQTGTYSFPLIPGHEFSGVVENVREKASESWIGKKVGIFPLIPCKKCPQCNAGQYEMCRSYSYLGSRTNGGFAEYVAVPVDNLIELGSNVTFEQAAMLEPLSVAQHAVRKAKPKMGQTVAICGLGTIGLLVAMLLKKIGVKQIFLIGNKHIQSDMTKELQIPNSIFLDSQKEDTKAKLLEMTDGQGVDVYFECVGHPSAICQAIEMVKPGGTLLLIGNPSGNIEFPQAVYWKILRNQLSLYGSWNSSFLHDKEDDWCRNLELLEKGEIVPEKIVSHRLQFEELETGLRLMRDKTQEYTKVMAIL